MGFYNWIELPHTWERTWNRKQQTIRYIRYKLLCLHKDLFKSKSDASIQLYKFKYKVTNRWATLHTKVLIIRILFDVLIIARKHSNASQNSSCDYSIFYSRFISQRRLRRVAHWLHMRTSIKLTRCCCCCWGNIDVDIDSNMDCRQAEVATS